MIDYEKYKNWFIDYTNDFKGVGDISTKFAIDLKIKHTFDTVSAMESIIEDMNFDEEDYALAKVLALFHDVGRFTQLKEYGHFNDKKSIDHAEESVRVLKETHILDDMNDEQRNIIYIAISNHNKFRISEKVVDEKTVLYSKLIRDADKIDIYRVLVRSLREASEKEFASMYFEIECANKVSPKIYDSVINNKPIYHADKVTIADVLVSNMDWVITDIYFKQSLKFIYDNEILKQYLDAYVDRYTKLGDMDSKIKEIYDYIMSKLEEILEIRK